MPGGGDVALLQSMPDEVRTAREHALLGAYGTALVYFQGVDSTLGRFLRTVEDPRDTQRWKKVRRTNLSAGALRAQR